MAAFAPPMLTQEQAVEIRVLARRGMGLREIARHTGLSRNTVRRYLRQPEVRGYGPRVPRPTKLDPFKRYVEERIAAARPRWIPATVLLRELRERGYDGGISQLKVFVAPFKQAAAEPVVRFETAPGVQMQADFTVVRRGRAALLAFVATLGYSRASFVRFTAGEDAATLIGCLREAFTFFGGVPQQVLLDNAKTVVIERDAYGDGLHRWHRDLLGLAEQFGFAPRLCRPYRAKTKGKVERFNGYLKGSFLVPLAASLKQAGLHLDVEVANAHVGRWLTEVANVRVHGTTGERPADRLRTEREHLLPLPTITPAAPMPAPATRRPVPVESLQHPLSRYDELLQVSA
jgi:transposase